MTIATNNQLVAQMKLFMSLHKSLMQWIHVQCSESSSFHWRIAIYKRFIIIIIIIIIICIIHIHVIQKWQTICSHSTAGAADNRSLKNDKQYVPIPLLATDEGDTGSVLINARESGCFKENHLHCLECIDLKLLDHCVCYTGLNFNLYYSIIWNT